MFDEFRRELTVDQIKIAPDHFTSMHPGHISNQTDFCEEDKNGDNLYGTGTLKGMESEYIDMYCDQNKSIQSDYMAINEELWKFLLDRYGGQVVKRYYLRGSSIQYTNVDAKMRAICVKILNS